MQLDNSLIIKDQADYVKALEAALRAVVGAISDGPGMLYPDDSDRVLKAKVLDWWEKREQPKNEPKPKPNPKLQYPPGCRGGILSASSEDIRRIAQEMQANPKPPADPSVFDPSKPLCSQCQSEVDGMPQKGICSCGRQKMAGLFHREIMRDALGDRYERFFCKIANHD